MKLSSLRLARKFLPQAKELRNNCLNSFLVVLDSGQVITANDAVCYGQLQTLYINDTYKKATPLVILNRKMNNTFSEEVNKAYDSWLMNDSPYAVAFSSKKWSTVQRYGVHVVDCEAPANLMVGGLIATRKLYENPHIVSVWYELVKRGVHPNLAYVFGHMLYLGGDKVVMQDYSSHCSINPTEYPNALIENFWFNKPKTVLDSYAKLKTYNKINAAWSDGEGKYTDWKRLLTKALEATKASVKPSNNPFNVVKNENSYVASDAFDSIAYTFNEQVKEAVG